MSQKTFAEKALARAAGLPEVVAGQIVDAVPDVALSHDNTAAIYKIFRALGVERVKYPERLAITLDHAVPAPLGRSQVDEQHLVFPMMDDRRQIRPAARQVGRRQLALEDRELQVVAIPAHGLKHLAQALVVADVVTNQIGSSHKPYTARAGRKFSLKFAP